MRTAHPSTAHDVLLWEHEHAPSAESRTALLAAMTVQGDRAAELRSVGQLDAARRALEVALRLGTAVHPSGGPRLVPHHAALAEVLEITQPVTAEAHYRRALENEDGASPTVLGARIRARLAALLHREGRLGEAEPLYADALSILEANGEAATGAVLANNLATLLWQLGRRREAIERGEWALAILGGQHAAGEEPLVQQQIDLAMLYARSGLVDRAAGLYRQVLNHRDSGELHLGLADALERTARPHDALAAYDRAYDRLREDRSEEDPEVIATLAGRARTLVATGRVDEGLGAIEAVLDNVTDEPSRWLRILYDDLLERAGRLEEAESRAAERGDGVARGRLLVRMGRLTEALDVLETASTREKPDRQSARISLVEVRGLLGLTEAAEHEARALANELVTEADDDEPQTVAALTALARSFRRLERLDEAERLFRTALGATVRTVGLTHPDAVGILDGLAATLAADGRPAEAEILAGHAMALAEHLFGEAHPTTIGCRSRRAHRLVALDRLNEAEALLADVDGRILGGRPTHHPDRATAAADLAQVRAAAGRHAEAEHLLVRAIQARSSSFGNQHGAVGADWAALARLRVRRRRLGEAQLALDRALAIQEIELRRAILGGDPRQRHPILARARTTTHDAITLHLRWRPSEPSAARLVLRTLLRRRGRGIELQRDALARLRRAGPDERRVLATLRELVARRAELLGRVPTEAAPFATWRDEWVEVEDRLQRAEQAAVEAMQREVVPVNVTAVAAALGRGRALLEFVKYRPTDFDGDSAEPARLAVYLLRQTGSGSTIVARDLGPHAAVAQHVRALRDDLQSGGGGEAHVRTLHRRLFEPLQAELEDVSELVVAAEPVLDLAPLELVAKGGLGVALTRVTSGRALLSGPVGTGGMVIVDPPGALSEVLRHDLSGAALGVVRESPSVGASSESLAGLALRHAGLRRALAVAGAPAQLLLLWPVDPAAIQRLLTTLEDRLEAGQPVRPAFAAAVDAVRQDPRFAGPGTTAAFVLSGAAEPQFSETAS